MAATVRQSSEPSTTATTTADEVALGILAALRVSLVPVHRRIWLYIAMCTALPLGQFFGRFIADPTTTTVATAVAAATVGAATHMWLMSLNVLRSWFDRRDEHHRETEMARAILSALAQHDLYPPEVTVTGHASGYGVQLTIPRGMPREAVIKVLPAARETLRVENFSLDDAQREVPGVVHLVAVENDLLARPLEGTAPVCGVWEPHNGVYTPIPIGIDAGGRTVALPLATRAGGGRRYLVGGASGSGKNSLFTQLLIGAARMGPDQVQLWLADLKGTEFAVYTGVSERYTWTAADAVTMLEDLVAEMRARQTQLRRTGRTVWDVDSDGPFILAAVDELTVITNNSDTSLNKRGQRALVELASLSRSVGICLIVALQTPNADYIPSAARNNFDDRIAFRVANDAAAEVIIPGISKNPDANPAHIFDEVDPDTGMSLSAGVCTAEGAVGRAKRLRCWFVSTSAVPGLLMASTRGPGAPLRATNGGFESAPPTSLQGTVPARE